MKTNPFYLSLVLLFLFIEISAQTISIDGEIRPRAEFKDGYKVLPATDSDFAFSISQRTRLNAFYGSKEFNAYISTQDIRVWGDVNQLDNGSNNKFALHQAWGEYFIKPGFSIKIGRQELVYDNSRILGNVGWAQQARAHDLGLVKYENEKIKFHLGLAFNQKNDVLFGTDYFASNANGVYTLNSNYKSMQFVWLNTKLGKSPLSLLFLNNGMESINQNVSPTEFKTLYSQTFGGRFTPNLGPLKLAAAFYYQMGEVVNESTDLSASYYALEANYPASEKLLLSAGFEYLSGTSVKDKKMNPNEIKSFTPLYGTNHKFNGHMDYFYVGNHANNVGLIDIYSTLKYTDKKLTFFVTPHYFIAGTDVYKSIGTTSTTFISGEYYKLDRALGLEIDFGISYAAQKNMSVQFGLSEMFGTETLGFIQGYSSSNMHQKTGTWSYIMFIFNPSFFAAK